MVLTQRTVRPFPPIRVHVESGRPHADLLVRPLRLQAEELQRAEAAAERPRKKAALSLPLTPALPGAGVGAADALNVIVDTFLKQPSRPQAAPVAAASAPAP